MNKNMNRIGVTILIGIFVIFYIVTTFFLDRRKLSKDILNKENVIIENNNNFDDEKTIINNLYNKFKILYDVVNNKFIVSQEDTITIGNIIYKRITNFDDVMNDIFTENGIRKYISDLNNYFAYSNGNYYLAGNLVSYQTYYFRGDESNIYVLNSSDKEINGIIYERWKGNNNTLATIRVVNDDGKWLVDDINILSVE